MPQQIMATNTVLQQGSQRQEQMTSVRQSATCFGKIFDALHSLNTKHSDFNQISVNLVSGERVNIA